MESPRGFTAGIGEARSFRGKLRLSAADELDDFEVVAGLHSRLTPEPARENVAIPLDRNAVRPHADAFEQRDNSKAVRNFLRFAVDHDRHFSALHAPSRAAIGAVLCNRTILAHAYDSFYSRDKGRGLERITYRSSSLPRSAFA